MICYPVHTYCCGLEHSTRQMGHAHGECRRIEMWQSCRERCVGFPSRLGPYMNDEPETPRSGSKKKTGGLVCDGWINPINPIYYHPSEPSNNRCGFSKSFWFVPRLLTRTLGWWDFSPNFRLLKWDLCIFGFWSRGGTQTRFSSFINCRIFFFFLIRPYYNIMVLMGLQTDRRWWGYDGDVEFHNDWLRERGWSASQC